MGIGHGLDCTIHGQLLLTRLLSRLVEPKTAKKLDGNKSAHGPPAYPKKILHAIQDLVSLRENNRAKNRPNETCRVVPDSSSLGAVLPEESVCVSAEQSHDTKMDGIEETAQLSIATRSALDRARLKKQLLEKRQKYAREELERVSQGGDAREKGQGDQVQTQADNGATGVTTTTTTERKHNPERRPLAMVPPRQQPPFARGVELAFSPPSKAKPPSKAQPWPHPFADHAMPWASRSAGEHTQRQPDCGVDGLAAVSDFSSFLENVLGRVQPVASRQHPPAAMEALSRKRSVVKPSTSSDFGWSRARVSREVLDLPPLDPPSRREDARSRSPSGAAQRHPLDPPRSPGIWKKHVAPTAAAAQSGTAPLPKSSRKPLVPCSLPKTERRSRGPDGLPKSECQVQQRQVRVENDAFEELRVEIDTLEELRSKLRKECQELRADWRQAEVVLRRRRGQEAVAIKRLRKAVRRSTGDGSGGSRQRRRRFFPEK